MRKIVLLLLAFMFLLTGCEPSIDKKLEKLGYNEEQIQTIITYSEDMQNMFLSEYNEDLYLITTNKDYKEENLNKYLEYYGLLDDELMYYLVNKNIIEKHDLNKLLELYSHKYFVKDNEDLYLYYIDKYNTVDEAIEIVNTKRYMELYTNIVTSDVSKDYLLLVNKYYQLPSDYEPDDLVSISSTHGKGMTREKVYEAFIDLYDDALNEGYNIKIVSAYRSYSYQDGLYNKYLSMDSKENVDTYSARPGHSEHQSGLCLDVSIPGYSIDDFYKTEASVWLKDNCYKYGFIIRYPEDKVEITGYQSEPWQIRYVGKEAAKYINDTGITFDEYYEVFVK